MSGSHARARKKDLTAFPPCRLRLAVKRFTLMEIQRIKQCFLFLLMLVAFGTLAADAPRPNFVYSLVDDPGWANCGFMGGTDIRTRNFDSLAKDGAILNAFYVRLLCSPTRAALMTGRYATHTGVYTINCPNAPWGLPAG